MAEFSKLIITNNGRTLAAKMMSGDGNIIFTKISSSDNIYTLKELENLTVLSKVKQTSLISKVTRTDKTSVKVETAFNNSQLITGYYMRALGLYAIDPDEGEILFGVTIETTGNCYMPPYNGATASGAYIQIITTVGNAENVFLKADVAAVATIGDINELREQFGNKVDKIPGKGLSTEDFTTAEKNKLSGIAPGAAAVSSSDANGNIKINGVETTVYTHPYGTNPHGTTKADVGLGNVGDFKAVSTAANQALTDSEQANARANIDAARQSSTYSKSETEQLITQKVSEIVANSPEDFDTLKEISDWIGNHENSAAAMNSAISANSSAISTKADKSNTYTKSEVDSALNNKVDKVSGKGLSTEDYTTAEKNKLSGIETGAQVNSITGVKGNAESSYRTGYVNITPANIGAAASGHTHAKSDITDFPVSLPASDVYSWAKSSTKPSYTASEVGAAEATDITVSGVSALASQQSLLGSFYDGIKYYNVINTRYQNGTKYGMAIYSPMQDNSEGLYYSKQNDSEGWVYSRMIVDSSNIGKFARSSKAMYTTKGTDGSNGWAELCYITVGGAYVNSPFRIMITQRGLKHPYFIDICFSSNSSPIDTVVNYFTLSTGTPVKTGAQAYIIKTDGTKPVFRVYVKKTQAWDIINILDLNRPHTDGFADLSIGWGTGHLADVSGGIAATDIGTTT